MLSKTVVLEIISHLMCHDILKPVMSFIFCTLLFQSSIYKRECQMFINVFRFEFYLLTVTFFP